MSKVTIPSVFPTEGVYEYSGLHADLSCMTPGAEIYYTINGGDPLSEGKVYHREDGLLLLPAEKETAKDYVIRAVACKEGMEPSEEAVFTYHIVGRKRGVYRHILMREMTEQQAGLICIEDYDRDKMYLIVGTEKAVLIDAGYDEEGDLPDLCRKLIGDEKPLMLIVAHGHPDHIAQLPNFLKAGCPCYMPLVDTDTVRRFSPNLNLTGVQDLQEGDCFDLGNTKLRVYTIPGHTPGAAVLLDESTGDLFSSDAFGSNRRYVPDSAWLQLGETSAEAAYNRVTEFLAQTEGKIRRIFTGHNEEIYEAVPYLTALQSALGKALTLGEGGLSPSLRSSADSMGSGTELISGDWRYDPIWVGANVRFLTEADRLAEPPRYAKGYNSNWRDA